MNPYRKEIIHMKKALALIAALVLLLSLSLSAVAEEETSTWPFVNTGVILSAPAKWSQLQGLLFPTDVGEIDPGNKIACAAIQYIPLNQEDQALVAQANDIELTDEQKARLLEILGKTVSLYYFFSVGNGKSFEDVQDVILQGESPDPYAVYELGQAGDYRFYFITTKPDSEATETAVAKLPEDCREEYLTLLKDTDTVIAAVALQKPVKTGSDSVGQSLSFELTDFSGNPVSSKDLFAGHKVTLVNLWASWCHPCAAEMPELEALWQDYGAKGAGFVGLCLDGYKEKSLADAKQVAADNGVTYPMLACTEELEAWLMNAMGNTVPTTFFVNEEGEILGEPIIGVQPDAYLEALEKFLAE